VGQQRARITTQVNLVWSIVLFVVSLILLGVSGLSFGAVEADPIPLATDTPPLVNTPMPEATTTDTPTLFPTTTATVAPLATPDLSETAPPTIVTAPPTLTLAPIPATDTPTAEPATAVVSSGVGVWLRAEPGTAGEQLEWLLDGTVLIVLAGLLQADGFEWQQVRTAAGLEGWVATDFIIYNNGN
jgi:hypothetical protein